MQQGNSIYTTPVTFRMNEAVLAKVQEKASQEGVNLSEFIRTAVRKEIREQS